MNIFTLIPASFYSADAYRHMREKASFGMGYALVLVLITTLAVVVYYGNVIHREIFAVRDGKISFFEDMVMQITDQIPLMTLKDGVLVTDVPEATVIRLSGEAFGMGFSDVEIATIDTTGNTTYANMQTPILVTRTDVVYEKDDKKEIKSIAELTEKAPSPMVINRAVATDIGQQLVAWVKDNLTSIYLIFGGMMWAFAIIYVYVARMIMLLLLGLVGIAFAGIRKLDLTYASAVSLASLSYTPVLLLDTVLFIARGDSPSTITLFIAGAVTLIAGIVASYPPKESA